MDFYYCGFTYGRIGFAVLEDRKFKSGPLGLVPPTGGRPDHISDPDFDPKDADVPDAVLLGRRQLDFLTAWAAGDPSADLDGNGEIDTRDFTAYLNLWAAGC